MSTTCPNVSLIQFYFFIYLFLHLKKGILLSRFRHVSTHVWHVSVLDKCLERIKSPMKCPCSLAWRPSRLFSKNPYVRTKVLYRSFELGGEETFFLTGGTGHEFSFFPHKPLVCLHRNVLLSFLLYLVFNSEHSSRAMLTTAAVWGV